MFILEFFKGRYSMRPKQISQFENSGFNSDQFFLWITNDKYTKFYFGLVIILSSVPEDNLAQN
jgi:hypothetical protein